MDEAQPAHGIPGKVDGAAAGGPGRPKTTYPHADTLGGRSSIAQRHRLIVIQAGCVGWIEATSWVAILMFCILSAGLIQSLRMPVWVAWVPLLLPILGSRWIRQACSRLVERNTRSRNPATARILARTMCLGLPVALLPMHVGAVGLGLPFFSQGTPLFSHEQWAPLGALTLVGWLLVLRPRVLLALWLRRKHRRGGLGDHVHV